MIHTYHCGLKVCDHLNLTTAELQANQELQAHDKENDIEGDLKPRNINGPNYTPVELATLYGFPADADGTGQTVGIISLGGGYTMSDLQAYLTFVGVSKVPTVVDVSYNGAFNNPADTSGANFEVCLDLDVVAAVAPGSTIRMYFAPNSFLDFAGVVQKAVDDNCNIISISWGLAELQWSSSGRNAMNTAIQNAANKGITVFVAAGDNGASDGYSGFNVDFPSSSPFAVACGGTTLTSANGVITNETVWGNATNSATGGGLSAVFNKPSYQNSVPLLNSVTKRGSPDIAANANPNTGYIIRVGSSYYTIGGTSAVSPLLAALTARINQKRVAASKAVLGLLQTSLYAASLSVFRDITVGNNFGYSAATGWDFTTGLGSPSSALSTYLVDYVPAQAPVSSFNASTLSGIAPLTVTFTDTSSNSPIAWSWNFGNGTTSTQQNPPAVTYNSAGSYTVSLTVTNTGGSSVSTKTLVVTSPAITAPRSVFTASTLSGAAPLTVTFTNTSTGNPTAWSWNFGNGTTSTLQNPPPITFTGTQTYTVTLTVTNSAGSNRSSQLIVVRANVPSANFSYTMRTVSFTDTSTNVPNSWLWRFGDGTTSTVKNPTKTYKAAGTYTVTLQASNASGSTTKSSTITIL
jgi:PKD repeat protein